MKTKRCSKCRKIKSLNEFYRHKGHKNGFGSNCKKCLGQYNLKRYKEKMKTGGYGKCRRCRKELRKKNNKTGLCWSCYIKSPENKKRIESALNNIKPRFGKNHPNWKGGKFKNPWGYILVYQPNHPSRIQNHVREHRLVMERKLGRYLRPWEMVHHKNGIKADNRIENLELMISNHAPGSCVSKQIIWAKALLSNYGIDEEKYA